MSEGIRGGNQLDQMFNSHTRFEPTSPVGEATVDYTRKDLRRLGLAVEGDYSDVSSVTIFQKGESRQVEVTPQLVTRPNGDNRTYFYPSESLRPSAR